MATTKAAMRLFTAGCFLLTSFFLYSYCGQFSAGRKQIEDALLTESGIQWPLKGTELGVGDTIWQCTAWVVSAVHVCEIQSISFCTMTD